MADESAAEHQYHLVEPSPWPALGALSLFVLAGGLVMFVNADHGAFMRATGPWLLPIGLAMVLYTMFLWFRDVSRESDIHHSKVVQLGLRYGMALFIASEVMFFAAWFWAFFNASLMPTEAIGGVWPPPGIDIFDPWDLPLLNTVILLTSSTTVTWAHHAILQGDTRGLKLGLVCTILLGVTFTGIQAYEYAHAGFGFAGHIYGSTFYMATGFHGAHVIIGTIFLCVCLLRAHLGHFRPDQHFGLEAAAWYWHFVDVVWLFLFSCIYVWPTL